MTLPINGVGAGPTITPINTRFENGGVGKAGDGGVDFGEALGDAFERAGSAERSAENASVRFAEGDPDVGIHEVVIAAEQANVSVRYATTLKNKLLEAYREIMNTQV